MRYKTRLYKRVLSTIGTMHGANSLSQIGYLAKANLSSIFYQLRRFVESGILIKKGKLYVHRAQLLLRTVITQISNAMKQCREETVAWIAKILVPQI